MNDPATASRLAASPETVVAGAAPSGERLVAEARLLGLRVRTRELSEDPAFAAALAGSGLAVVFRYGVAVTFTADGDLIPALDRAIAPYLSGPADAVESETAEILLRPQSEDRIGAGGAILLAGADPERLLLVATVLARSVVLARHETLVTQAFEVSAPLVAELREHGRVTLSIRAVMKIVGDALAPRHQVLGTVQAGERPDLLWDYPELDRLYARLEDEYELEEREEALDRKFGALGDFGEALLDVVQDKRAYRLEVAIIALISFEIVISLVDIALR